MLNINEVIQTIEMIKDQHLDIRTVTMHLSLFDCIRDGKAAAAKAVGEKIFARAGRLKEVAERLQAKYGIPIINKRVSVSPISLIGMASGGYLEIAREMDRVAKAIDIDFIGGYTALVQKGMSENERGFIATIPAALASTARVCSSVNIGSTRAGINMDAVALMGKIIKETAALTAAQDSIGCAKLVVFANAVEDNPFMAGSFNGTGEGDAVINVGISGPGVVKTALEKVRGADCTVLAETVKQTAFKITRVGELVAREAANMLNATFGIVDLSLAPTPIVGDSVGHILEEMGLTSVGAPGTTACLALLNDAVKKGGVMASSHIGGLSGAFIPVSEDIGMINAAARGALSLEKLEAMTAVCSVGLDMIAVPGDTSASTVSAIIADEAAIGIINNKTTAVRIIPVEGKTSGYAEFGGLLGRAPIMSVNPENADVFIARGGRIPAPIHSNKN
ncbi:MAG: PFL family protein [Clostridiales bacterium]|nr:PFL family protein [Clostridiales bacterium]